MLCNIARLMISFEKDGTAGTISGAPPILANYNRQSGESALSSGFYILCS